MACYPEVEKQGTAILLQPMLRRHYWKTMARKTPPDAPAMARPSFMDPPRLPHKTSEQRSYPSNGFVSCLHCHVAILSRGEALQSFDIGGTLPFTHAQRCVESVGTTPNDECIVDGAVVGRVATRRLPCYFC